MSYLIDTNVISELIKPTPHPAVLSFAKTVPESALYLSVLTLGEIQKGIAKLTDSVKQQRLSLWLEQDLPTWFRDRILPIDNETAICWGHLQANSGRSLPVIDSLLAATAITHRLKLVTRNTSDFIYPALALINPWLL
jgi:predicted nucleic acid-binding protein